MASSYQSEGDTNEPVNTSSSGSDLQQKISELEKRINETFSELFGFLLERKTYLLGELEELKVSFLSKVTEQTRIEDQRKKIFDVMEKAKKENVVSEIVAEPSKTIDAQLKEHASIPVTFDYDFKTRNLAELKETIARFGSIQSTTLDYTQMKGPKLCFGGSGGGIASPRALAVDDNERMFVADANKPSILVYSSLGNFMTEFGRETLAEPWGVCCGEDKLFVTDHRLHAVFSFSLSNFVFIKRVGNLGSQVRELNSPTSVNFDVREREVYVADYLNNRIAIFDPDLNFKRYVLENSVEGPICVNITEKRLFILECRKPNFRSYTKEGTDLKKHYSIVGKKEVIKSVLFFCVDSKNNLILSDYGENCIRVVNEEGEAIKSIQNDRLFEPTGICLSQAGDGIIVVTHQKLFPIQLY